MKVERRVISGQAARHAEISSSVLPPPPAAMRRSVSGWACWRDVQIGQHQTIRHQRDQVAHMRIGIDVMQPDPCAKAAQIARQIGDMARWPRSVANLRSDHRRWYPG